ncbi:MAG: M23 family metallopeptidase [bacterium]|nr:hypothetical protein [Gammaproteobacteria bacterium]
MKIARWILSGLLVVLLILATLAGVLLNYLMIFLLASTVAMLVTFIVASAKKQIPWNIFKEQLYGHHLAQRLLRNVTWITCGFCVYIAVIPIQFQSAEFTQLMLMLWGSVIALCVLDWMPRKQIGKTFNITLSVFLVFLGYQLALVYWPSDSRDGVELKSPFKGNWYVLHGGNSALINHHHFAGSQKYAMDILLPADGALPLQQVTDLQQYETHGQALYSPVDGKVVAVENVLEDQQIGKTDVKNLAGNHIVIETQSGQFLLLAHLQQNSVQVAVGDGVKTGQQIANFGNSGNTSQPHLHIQAMTHMDFLDAESKPIPLFFKIGDEPPASFKRNDILPGLSD